MKLLAISFLIIIITALNSHHTPTERFLKLLDDHWEHSLQKNPLFATGQGDHRFNDRLPETGLDAMESAYESNKEFLARLSTIPRDSVSIEHQVNYDIFRIQLENAIQDYENNGHLLPLNGWWDYHASFADLANRVPLNNLEDYRNYLSRLKAFPDYNGGYIERLRRGAEIGFVRPQIVFDDYLESVRALITERPEESRLFEPFNNFPDQIDEEERNLLRQEASRVIRESVIAEFQKLHDFLSDEYVPEASASIGITDVPGGEAYYDYLVKMYTTIDITADEIHQTGLDEVARIRAEMMEIVESEGFEYDFDRFTEYLRTDDRFYAETPEELMKETALILKRMDGKLPELFKTLPRLPYGIIEVPNYLAPRTATAYYSRGAADGTRAGNYAVNTYNLPARPLYEVTALSLHEAVPGHHLQIALQQELENLPKFRTTASFTAYTEGWALYSERLGLEVGFYEDPYQNFGRLSYEMWRALRLVVDTGMHAKGWTRDQAVEYMASNSALSLHNIRSEVNRYIFWPGQALSYKMGEIKIRELREMAEDKLSSDFELREFHDVVLLSGAVPLSVLEQNVGNWVDSLNEYQEQM
jgi:uncharacterized protein (DUF885 family)